MTETEPRPDSDFDREDFERQAADLLTREHVLVCACESEITDDDVEVVSVRAISSKLTEGMIKSVAHGLLINLPPVEQLDFLARLSSELLEQLPPEMLPEDIAEQLAGRFQGRVH